MPASHEAVPPKADPRLVSYVDGHGRYEVGWTPEAEAALVLARESLDRGDDVEGYRLIGLAARRQMLYEERNALIGFALCGASGGIMGALIASLLWWLVG